MGQVADLCTAVEKRTSLASVVISEKEKVQTTLERVSSSILEVIESGTYLYQFASISLCLIYQQSYCCMHILHFDKNRTSTWDRLISFPV